MNKTIFNQLKRCEFINTSDISENDTVLVFKKRVDTAIIVGKCYIVELDDSLLNRNMNTILVTNWNANSVPENKWYKCEVVKKMGNMIKVNGLSYDLTTDKDLNTMWSGWLPQEKIKILKEI